MKNDPLAPSLSTLTKLGSLIAHCEELLSPHGHHFDRIAMNDLLKDKEVVAWMKQMRKLALLPEPRNK